jgi:hypothetical protein
MRSILDRNSAKQNSAYLSIHLIQSLLAVTAFQALVYGGVKLAYSLIDP